MSQFEFVQISFAIILGLGVTSILASLGDQIRLRHIQKLSPLHVCSQCLLLYSLLVWLWGFWATREINWSISIFIFHALSPVFLALAAHMSKIEISQNGEAAQTQYFRNRQVFYGFWALASLIGIGQTQFYVYIGQLDISSSIPLMILRAIGLTSLITLAVSGKSIVHWVFLTVLTMIYSSVIFTFFFSLSGST